MFRSLLVGLLLTLPLSAFAADSDGDEVENATDNCIMVANPGQTDFDGDQLGNACDCDFNQDGGCGQPDYSTFIACFGKLVPASGPPEDPTCEESDMNGDGGVGQPDYSLFIRLFGGPPGPSGPIRCVGDAASIPVECGEGVDLFCPDLAIPAAHEQLEICVDSVDPLCHPDAFSSATVRYALTRVLRPAFAPEPGPDPAVIDSFSELVIALGFLPSGPLLQFQFSETSGRNPLDWTAEPPTGPEGECTSPRDAAREVDLERVLNIELIPELDEALEHLALIEELWVDETTWVDECTFHTVVVGDLVIEIDHSDVLALRSFYHALRGLIFLANTYDLDFDIGELCQGLYGPLLTTIESFLADHPEFLRLSDPAQPAAAQQAAEDLKEALLLFEETLDAIQNETDDQLDDLISIDPERMTPAEEEALRDRLARLAASFHAPVDAAGMGFCGESEIHLGVLFADGGLEARDFLPPVSGNIFDLEATPDSSFDGLFPGLSTEELICSLDDRSPQLTEPADRNLGLVANPVLLVLTLTEDGLLGAVGSGIDLENLRVSLLLDPDAGAECPFHVNDIPLAHSDTPVDVTDFLSVVSEPDGSVGISGEIEANPTDPEATRCDATVYVDIPDLAGNVEGETLWMRILTRGALLTYDPEEDASEPSPLDFTLEIQPVGDVDPSLITIYLETEECGPSYVNGNLISEDWGWFWGDVTSYLHREIAPDGTRTYSATITTTNSCEIRLSPEMGEFNLDSARYEVIHGGWVTADPPSDFWPPVDVPLSFSIRIDPVPGVDLSGAQMFLDTTGPCGPMDLNGNAIESVSGEFHGDVASYLDLVIDPDDGSHTYSGTLDTTYPACEVTFTPMLGGHLLTNTYYSLERSDVLSFDPEPGLSYPPPLFFSISVRPVDGLDPSDNVFYLDAWDCGTGDLNGHAIVEDEWGSFYEDVTSYLDVAVAPDKTHTYSGTISFTQSCEIWLDPTVAGFWMSGVSYEIVPVP